RLAHRRVPVPAGQDAGLPGPADQPSPRATGRAGRLRAPTPGGPRPPGQPRPPPRTVRARMRLPGRSGPDRRPPLPRPPAAGTPPRPPPRRPPPQPPPGGSQAGGKGEPADDIRDHRAVHRHQGQTHCHASPPVTGSNTVNTVTQPQQTRPPTLRIRTAVGLG